MPDWKSIVLAKLAQLKLNGAAEADLSDELRQHLEDRYRELLSGGLTEHEAHVKTSSELDDLRPLRAAIDRIEERRHRRLRQRHTLPAGDSTPRMFFGSLWNDLRYAFRNMRNSPLFVAVVILTLGLGIGANTTVFTLINTLILNPLPVRDPAELASLELVQSQRTSRSAAPLPMSYADLKDFQRRNEVFSSLAGYTNVRAMTWRSDSGTERIFGELVTGNYFATLGLTPSAGRFFLPEEDGTPGAHPVAVVSYGTWRARFGGSPDIVGRTLRIDNLVLTVIGVAPPHFIGIHGIFGPDLWIPAAMAEQVLPNEKQSALYDRGEGIFQGAGRLKPGATVAQAQANAATIAADLAREYPAAHEGNNALARPIRDVLFSETGSGSGSVLFAGAGLLAVVGIVLLIACSNVANLMLARSAARQQEMAVRLAMGASRARLVRQLLTESVLLGLLSGILGLFIGYAGLHALFGALPNAANFIEPRLDATVFLYALLVSLATGLVFGIAPAFRASKANVADALKEEARTSGRSRRRVTAASALLVSQVAFSFLLLVTAALFLRSIGRAYNIDPGFQTAHLAIFMTGPRQAGYAKPQAKAFYNEVREQVKRNPAIESVSWSSNLPLWGRAVDGLRIEGRQQQTQAERTAAILNIVDADYFETAGVSIDRGRALTGTDRESSAPVAVVNEKLAHDYWPDGNAIGKRIGLPGEKQMRQIVGIARTANYTGWGEAPQPCVYVPLEQNYSDAMILYVRTRGDPREILTPVQRAIRTIGPKVLATDVRTGSQIVDGGLFQAKMGVVLLTVFGLLALGLASIGLYGIMAYSVNQRKREIGLRMALGAARPSVLGLMLRQGMSLVLAGVLIGYVAALVAAPLLNRMLYGVNASDPVSVAAAAVVLLAVALVACYVPARRASRVDPLVALREG